MALTGNKGEWSELYVLVSLLAEGKLHQADYELNKDSNNIYEVIKAYKNESDYRLEFDRKDKVILFKIEKEVSTQIGVFSLEELQEISKLLLKGIQEGQGNSFAIIEAENFLTSTSIKKLKADSKVKADIKLKIYDHRLAKETDLGFSIKSLLGGDSTLFNTGYGNNFIYSVQNNLNESVLEFNKRTYKPLGGLSKLSFRLQELERLNSSISFKTVQSKQLWRNLKMVDGDLPDILAWALYYRWLHQESSLIGVSDLLEKNDPLNFYNNQPNEQKLYEYKLKRFLTEAAMGMTSETAWMGEYDSFGGVIIAKSDGDIVCFHIYDFNLFRNYLLDNTKFEQPATGEDPLTPGKARSKGKKYYYGWLYEEDVDLFYKINLQIRFK